MNPRSFREYDIRGVAERDLDDATVRALGLAFGKRAAGRTVVVGRDPRVHSPRLFAALTDGLRVHADVIDIGVVPTPVLYFAAHHLGRPSADARSGDIDPQQWVVDLKDKTRTSYTWSATFFMNDGSQRLLGPEATDALTLIPQLAPITG